jgi:L-ascorbate metabolism protein UlaG (beta-lactamase superfamily)
MDIQWFGHSAVCLTGEKKIYVDPFKMPKSYSDADIVLCTHNHFDHCSIEDIKKVMTPNTSIVCPPDCLSKLNELMVKEIIPVEPCQEITIKNTTIEAIPAYNVNKFRSPGIAFHPQENYWVGYVVTLDKQRVYFSGDTDKIPEMALLHDIDIAFVAVGGTYTMSWQEAVEAVLLFHPKKAIPYHYSSVVGSVQDAVNFKNEIIKHKIKSEVLSMF